MSVLVSHPTGNANLRAVLRALNGVDALAEFWTTVALPGAAAWPLPERVRRKLAQRAFPEAPWARTHIRPVREGVRLLARRAGPGALNRHERGWASTDGVYQALDRAVARRLHARECRASAVYAYEDGAHASFTAARQTGHIRIYDLPIAHWRTLRRLLEEEAERRPDWAGTMEGLRDSPAKHDRKDAEIALADHVVVASSFTRDSLHAAFSDLRVDVTPYGCPPPALAEPARRGPDAPIELLFAGHLSQRKGLADLVAALQLLEVNWRLTLAGSLGAEAPADLARLLRDPRCTWLGVVDHATMLERMGAAHMFVFPSIVEGFGMVITEALSRGLPVITTPHTAGPDILEDGSDGFIVPIRSPEAIAERITRLAEDEPRRRRMARAALEAAGRMSWRGYEDRIAALVTDWTCAA